MQTKIKQVLNRLSQEYAPREVEPSAWKKFINTELPNMKEDLSVWKRFINTELPNMEVGKLLQVYQDHIYASFTSEGMAVDGLPTPEELRQAIQEDHDVTASTAASTEPDIAVAHQTPWETLDEKALAEAVRDHLLEEKEQVDAEGLPVPFFRHARLAWTMSNPEAPHHAEVVRGFTLAFGSLIEWFATLATTGITTNDWNYITQVTIRLCQMIYSRYNREASVTIVSFQKMATALAILIQRRQEQQPFPFQHPNLLALVAEAAGPGCQEALDLLITANSRSYKERLPLPANDEEIVNGYDPGPMMAIFGIKQP